MENLLVLPMNSGKRTEAELQEALKEYLNFWIDYADKFGEEQLRERCRFCRAKLIAFREVLLSCKLRRSNLKKIEERMVEAVNEIKLIEKSWP